MLKAAFQTVFSLRGYHKNGLKCRPRTIESARGSHYNEDEIGGEAAERRWRSMHVLIVEDEVRLADALGQVVREQRCMADVVYDGEDGLAYALSDRYDAVILDVMLPKRDGFSVVREMRANKIATPVLMLTARDDVTDKVKGLDCGADDYMTKPFAPEELMARIRALTRRQGEVVLNEMTFGDLSLDLTNHDLNCGEKRIRLGFKEFAVLRCLMARPETVVPKEELIVKVWGTEQDVSDNNLEAYISFLRKKFFHLGSKAAVATVRKLGYRLTLDEEAL